MDVVSEHSPLPARRAAVEPAVDDAATRTRAHLPPRRLRLLIAVGVLLPTLGLAAGPSVAQTVPLVQHAVAPQVQAEPELLVPSQRLAELRPATSRGVVSDTALLTRFSRSSAGRTHLPVAPVVDAPTATPTPAAAEPTPTEPGPEQPTAPPVAPVAMLPGQLDNGSWLFPVSSRGVASPFGYRSDPFTGRSSFHSGVDLSASCGTPVRATREGTVSFAGWLGGYGNHIKVDHGNGTSSTYSHLSMIGVSVGQHVDQLQQVGAVGTTGRSTGCHLHFEIKVNNAFADPLAVLGAAPASKPSDPADKPDATPSPSASATPSTEPDPTPSADPTPDVTPTPDPSDASPSLPPVDPTPSNDPTPEPPATPSPSDPPSVEPPAPPAPETPAPVDPPAPPAPPPPPATDVPAPPSAPPAESATPDANASTPAP